MRGWPFGLACPLLCWAAVPLVIHAQAQTARISGTVVDPAEHFLPGVEVTLTSVEGDPPTDDAPAGSVVASTITSETGQFEFDGLSAGSYIIISPNYRGTGEAYTRLFRRSKVARSTYGSRLPRPACLRLSPSSPRRVPANLSRRTSSRSSFCASSSSPPTGFRRHCRCCPVSFAILEGASASTAHARARAPCS